MFSTGVKVGGKSVYIFWSKVCHFISATGKSVGKVKRKIVLSRKAFILSCSDFVRFWHA